MRSSEPSFICRRAGRWEASRWVNDAADRQTVPMALRLYVPSDNVNEAENLLKTKARKTDFSPHEGENILKKSHLQ